MSSPYFKPQPDAPQPLIFQVERRVRFDELDPLNIVWHGHYASFFEDARVALGNHYGIGYEDFFRHGVTIPLKKFHADFHQPMTFHRLYCIEARLHWNEAARLDFEFQILAPADETSVPATVISTGYSVHLMVDATAGVLVAKPPFFEAFCQRWRNGEFALREKFSSPAPMPVFKPPCGH